MIKIKINGKNLEVEENITILKAAKKVGIKFRLYAIIPIFLRLPHAVFVWLNLQIWEINMSEHVRCLSKKEWI